MLNYAFTRIVCSASLNLESTLEELEITNTSIAFVQLNCVLSWTKTQRSTILFFGTVKAKELNDGVYSYLNEILKVRSNTNLRKAQMVLRLVDIYGAERVGNACIRAFAYDNYEAGCIKNILEKNLDSKGTHSCANKVVDINLSAYIRSPNEYSSSMEVNYG